MKTLSRKAHPEWALQKAAIQWLNWALVPPAFAWSVDHAGGGQLLGALRKARGVRAGQPDIWVLAPGPKLVGIELKSEGGRASNEQLAFGGDCYRCGVLVYLCRDLEDVEDALKGQGIGLRAIARLSPEPSTVAAARSAGA